MSRVLPVRISLGTVECINLALSTKRALRRQEAVMVPAAIPTLPLALLLGDLAAEVLRF